MPLKKLAEYSPFGRRLLEIMRSYDPPMTNAEFARFIGISKATLWNWIAGKSQPRHSVLALLSLRTKIPEAEWESLIAESNTRASATFQEVFAYVEQRAGESLPYRRLLEILRPTLDPAWQISANRWRILASYVLDRAEISTDEKARQIDFLVECQNLDLETLVKTGRFISPG